MINIILPGSLQTKCCIILLLFTGFSGFSQENYKTEMDVLYYSDSLSEKDSYVNEKCKLDIYYPVNLDNYPTVIWFHGGGLTGGSREIPEALKNKGFAVVGAGYRLSPKVKSEQCIKDAAAAIAWVFKHIGEYGGDPDLIFVSGHSAGGYLAMMAALDKDYLKPHHVDADKIAEVIPFSGHTITHFNIRKEMGLSDIQPLIDQYAPLYHVRDDAPHMLLITGDREKEMLGRYEENAYFLRMMKLAGHKDTELYELEGYGHNMVQPALPLLVREVQQRSKEISRTRK
ncbi:alpha/beta hydrolase [Sinomicrobium weinanense]|uniref:Alpha/beta hydrolase n=1 Tax=Sinomicrobium weinanense TaxID=2842200 RepID=A0A926JV33_9FLAO|nr:alpha/beta hydrolase [Sinomicrobium weinanense]MBC9798118.1 alpha/beta hydrolase [Sinomicrobium weinanense]MBU3122988.1 alpha/beta hydrolase [Sinomicrobium weinanense]